MSNKTMTIEYHGAGYVAQTHTAWIFFNKFVFIEATITLTDEEPFTRYWFGPESEYMVKEQALLQGALRDLGTL